MSPARSESVQTFELPEKFSVATTTAVHKGQLTKMLQQRLWQQCIQECCSFKCTPLPMSTELYVYVW